MDRVKLDLTCLSSVGPQDLNLSFALEGDALPG